MRMHKKEILILISVICLLLLVIICGGLIARKSLNANNAANQYYESEAVEEESLQAEEEYASEVQEIASIEKEQWDEYNSSSVTFDSTDTELSEVVTPYNYNEVDGSVFIGDETNGRLISGCSFLWDETSHISEQLIQGIINTIYADAMQRNYWECETIELSTFLSSELNTLYEPYDPMESVDISDIVKSQRLSTPKWTFLVTSRDAGEDSLEVMRLMFFGNEEYCKVIRIDNRE